MPKGDPVSLVRDVPSGAQKVYNRTRKEAHTIQSDHCVLANDSEISVILECPGANWHVRFTEIHCNYGGQGAGVLAITDGTTAYTLAIGSTVARLRFDTTRWAADADVTITLSAGGAVGYLNVLGAFAEKLSNPNITV